MKLIVVIAWAAVLTACSNDVEKPMSGSIQHDSISGPRMQRIDDITTRIVMPSGQSLIIYGREGILAIDANLALPDDLSTKDKGISLNFTLESKNFANMLVGDRVGIQEYHIISPREIRKGKFSDSNELRNNRIEVPGMAPFSR